MLHRQYNKKKDMSFNHTKGKVLTEHYNKH